MTAELLYCITMTDHSESRGAAAEFLSAQDYNLSSWKDEESQEITHTVYFPDEASAKETLAFLEKAALAWKDFGIELDSFRYSTLKKEDWAEVWKLHFKTMIVSPRLVIKPSWENYQPAAEQRVIELDPGMSFGTGQHATTKSCLAALDAFTAAETRPLSMLDAGSGSGILSIAACKLGCTPVCAFDIDPDTIEIARENARKNGIFDEDLPICAASLEAYEATRRFDIVAANILSSALIAGRRKLLSLLAPGGKLILAGILASEYDNVKRSFEELGCVELSSVQEKEWKGGAFSGPSC